MTYVHVKHLPLQILQDNFLDTYPTQYEVIVIGSRPCRVRSSAGLFPHGPFTLLLTISLEAVARMSCNPAVGGLAKGQLVKEIDALVGRWEKYG